MPLNIDDNRVAMNIPPLLRLAFRPLFLGGTLFSILAIAWWTYFWTVPFNWQPYGGPIWWHGHEMLFGFGAAIIVGFLLTAVQTWTGVIGLRGSPLLILVLCWLTGRLVLAFGAKLPPLAVASVDLLYLLFSTVAMAYPVLKAKQWRNLMFVPLLLILTLLNAASHWGIITQQIDLAIRSLHGAILIVVLIIAILGGRVIPFFTANRTKQEKAQPIIWLEALSIGSILLLAIIALIGFSHVSPSLIALLSVIAALCNGWRCLRWGYQHCWHIPLLWSLHLAYAFIPLGFLALALYGFGYTSNISAALHSFTVGAMGGMILAMISRVTLGHTGRPLEPPRMIVPAYILILAGAALRVVLPGWLPELTSWSIGLAGAFWVMAYGIYCFYYGPMLLTTRADGRPG